MMTRKGLEALSAELLSELLFHLPLLQDRVSLLLVCNDLRDKIIPYIYDRWEFHGYKHSFNSLFQFLRTVVLNPELASHVHELDIGEWDKKQSHLLGGKEKEEMERQEAREEETYDRYIQIFQKAVGDLRMEEYSVNCLKDSINRRDTDGLIAFLIASLPQLQTLYISVPQVENGISLTLADLSSAGILGNLKTIYICSSLQTTVSQCIFDCIIMGWCYKPLARNYLCSRANSILFRSMMDTNTFWTWIGCYPSSEPKAFALSLF
jgi:hypothetical protein